MWRTAAATMTRNQQSNRRAYPWTFTFGHIIDGVYLVLVSYLSYTYLIRGDVESRFAVYAGTSDYLAFVMVGGMLHLFSVSMMMNVSRALITEWREGTLEGLLLSPFSRFGYLAGTAIQQLFRCGIELAVVVTAGLLLGLRLPGFALGPALLGALLYLLACFSMGLLLGCVMLHTRDTYIVQNTLFSLTALLCGFLFPVAYLPAALERLSAWIPLTQALTCLRGGLITGTAPPLRSVAWMVGACLAMTAVALGIGVRIERRLFDRSK